MGYADLLATVYFLVGILTTLLGLVILRENTGARLNRVTAMMLFFAGVGAILGAGSIHGVQAQMRGPAASPLVANFAYLWEFFFPTLLLFAASFPEEAPWLRRHSGGDVLVFLPHTIHFCLMFTATIWGRDFGLSHLGERFSLLGGLADVTRVLLRQFFAWHLHLFSLVNLTYVGLSTYMIGRNLGAARMVALHNQIRVILVGIGIGVALYSLGAPLNVLLGLRLEREISATLLVGALAIWSGTIGYAIVRHRFLDARWIVRRTILYAVAAAIVVGVYLQIARELSRAMQGLLRIPQEMLDWVALMVPLVLFQPVMGRIEEALEALLMRGRREVRNVLMRLSHEMSSNLNFESFAKGLVAELPDALMVGGAAVLLRRRPAGGRGGGYAVAAERGMARESLDLLLQIADTLPAPGGAVARPLTIREWLDAAERIGRGRKEARDVLRAGGVELTYDLIHGGERLGILALGRKLSGTRYSGEEVGMLASLAVQAGVALKNSLLHRENLDKAVLEEEMALARRIQQRFLPSRFPSDLPVEVYGVNMPSKQVGGDYFDFFPVTGGYALAVADVSGKGVGAALLASMLQASLRTLMQNGTATGKVVERVNTMLCESTSSDQFVTLFLARLDVENLVLTYCNAGHNYPIHVRGLGGGEALGPSQLVLGVDERISYEEHRRALAKGDLVLLYTDGVTEARSPAGDEFGEERLTRLMGELPDRSAERIVASIRGEVLGFTQTEELQDDMTMLVLRVP
ncbi:MAG: PP2C family protein-serine/threonine phosphatase [Candidatus Eisenbacteria bacterium]|nr:PP2C family protein-serine/threonine phosphatase [Candidatus Eisenbacteria bacterium]